VPSPETWRPLLEGSHRLEILSLVREVAGRLAEPGAPQRAAEIARSQTGHPGSVYWLAQGLAQGDAGLALLFGQLDVCFPEEGWDRLAHRALQEGVGNASREAGMGLFSGLPGLALVAHLLSRQGRRYQKLLASLDAELSLLVQQALEVPLQTSRAARDWDLVSGLVGLGVLAWTRNHPALPDVLARLETMASQTSSGSGFFVPGECIANPSLREEAPEGHLDLGLAHGIAGPLALLGLTGNSGPTRATRRLADLLQANRSDDEWGPNWSAAAPLQEGALVPGPPTHAAWCYGAPGIARALWHAGFGERALEAMQAVARRTPQARRLVSPGLCHGFAGLLAHALRFWNDCDDPTMESLALEMVARLEEAWDPQAALGFQAVEPGGVRVDQPGFLEGAPGVALALLAASTDREPTWDRVLLLS